MLSRSGIILLLHLQQFFIGAMLWHLAMQHSLEVYAIGHGHSRRVCMIVDIPWTSE